MRAIETVSSGTHEPTIRELRLAPPILVSEPLREFSGVLTSAPVYVGASGELLDRAGA